MIHDPTKTHPLFHYARGLIREPLTHFLLFGAILFFGADYFGRTTALARITITEQQVKRLSDNYRLQYGIVPSSTQVEALIDNAIRQEILYREALRLGLDADDEIIRRRLVQKYEFLHQDLSAPEEPSSAQLLDYYYAHLSRYRTPETVTLAHLYFSPDVRGDEEAREAAWEAALSLNRQRPLIATNYADQFPGPTQITDVTRDGLVRIFGRSALIEEVFKTPVAKWSPPTRSGLGWHTIHVNAVKPSRQLSFAEVRDSVRRDYLDELQLRINAEAFAKLRRHFVIVRESNTRPAHE